MHKTLRKKRPYSELFWSVFFPHSVRIRTECGKKRTRITPSTDTFYVVRNIYENIKYDICNIQSIYKKLKNKKIAWKFTIIDYLSLFTFYDKLKMNQLMASGVSGEIGLHVAWLVETARNTECDRAGISTAKKIKCFV